MNIYGLFPEPDQPWVPTLLDVERMKAAEPDGSPVDWRRFGWSALEVPESAGHVIARFDILGTKFLQRYAGRMLNQETMEMWQTRLQNRFDEVVDKYERAYALYEMNEEAMLNGSATAHKVSVKALTDGNGTSSDSGEQRYSDTPDQAINESDNYAGNITKTKGSKTYSNSDSHSSESEEKLTGESLVRSVNNNVDGWVSIDTAFIASFENNFMNIWWY